MSQQLTNEQRKAISKERQHAVRSAWKEEKSRVQNGQGTRDWSQEQQKEILTRGAVSGFEGHHMKSVALYPEHAGNAQNIQFLNEEEHFLGAHQGDYHTLTNGYYDPETQTMHPFQDAELVPVPEQDLSERYENQLDLARETYLEEREQAYVPEQSPQREQDMGMEV